MKFIYTESPFKNPCDRTPKSHLRLGYHRINACTIGNIPLWCDLVVHNGCPVRCEDGYLAPIGTHRFTSAQEVSDFLHTEGREGLFQVSRYSDLWEVTECVQMSSKREAVERASQFGWIFGWQENDTILC